jgi:hypothetical protein
MAPKHQCRARAMTDHKTSQADEAHIATAEYRREQSAGLDRMAQLKVLRLAQAPKAKARRPKHKARATRDSKTRGFGRWS